MDSTLARSLVAVAAILASCNRSSTTTAPSASESPSSAPATASARPPKNLPLADERIEIPAGVFRAGSVPGEPGRVPEVEPRSTNVELGAYQIDRLPYPNDPKQPALTNVTRDEARKKCAERNARLCTELEWERACKGPGNEPYPTGAGWDAHCAEDPRACASGYEVLGMGAALREWTASDVVPTDAEQPRRAAIRGAEKTALGPLHRCASRRGIDGDAKASDLGFRCCSGPPNAAVVKEPSVGQTFSKISISAERLTKLFQADPRTRDLAKDVKYFREPDAANTVVSRGPGDKKGFLFTVAPLIWNPTAGSEYLLVTGRSGENTSFIVAYFVIGDDDYRLASSFVMKNEQGPVAFAYSGYIRPRLHFSTCWGCPGETGKILFREPDGVVIVQP